MATVSNGPALSMAALIYEAYEGVGRTRQRVSEGIETRSRSRMKRRSPSNVALTSSMIVSVVG